eukprot:378406_1
MSNIYAYKQHLVDTMQSSDFNNKFNAKMNDELAGDAYHRRRLLQTVFNAVHIHITDINDARAVALATTEPSMHGADYGILSIVMTFVAICLVSIICIFAFVW